MVRSSRWFVAAVSAFGAGVLPAAGAADTGGIPIDPPTCISVLPVLTTARRVAVLITAAFLAFPAATSGAVEGYTFAGGTKEERETAVAALGASSFNWTLLPGPIAIHIVRGEPSHSLPHEVSLDADLLDSGEFAWGVVQHEFAHQVDYLLLDDTQRALLLHALGGQDWCYGVPGLAHDQYGCERFASTFAWSFWPSPENSMRPTQRGDGSAAMAPARFRTLVMRLTSRAVSRSVEKH